MNHRRHTVYVTVSREEINKRAEELYEEWVNEDNETRMFAPLWEYLGDKIQEPYLHEAEKLLALEAKLTNVLDHEGKWDGIIDAAATRTTGEIDFATVTYVTEGGTYIIACSPKLTDDGKPHDLVAILPAALGGTRVIPLRPTVNPDLIEALTLHLDLAPERKDHS